jgi:hypothetical protein
LNQQFFQAIGKKDLSSVKKFVDQGVDINKSDNLFGYSPLMHAVHDRDNIELAKLFIDNGAEVNFIAKEGTTALTTAAERGNVQAVTLLLDNGANINYQMPNGFTALMSAAGNNKPEVVKILLAYGADKKIKDEKGLTALDYIVKQKNDEMMQLLRDVQK